jgi:hypothetical protein
VPSWGQPQPTALSAGGGQTCALISSFAECWGWNAFGQLGNNGTGDTTSWIGQDTDKDGCIDAYELGPSHAYGGQRDPTNFWDFFDTPNDSRTTLSNAMTTTSPTLPAWVAVGSITGFPAASASEPKTFWIDNEIFKYTDQRTTPSIGFYVTERAQNGSAAASHSSGTTVVSNWRDKMVNSDDYNRISARYSSSGSASADPLAPPPPAPTYYPAFDRQDDPNSSEAWDLIGPDGHVLVADILFWSYQSGDTCATPTPTLTPTPTPTFTPTPTP